VGELGGPAMFTPLLELLLRAKVSADVSAAEQALDAVALRGSSVEAAVAQLIASLGKAQGQSKVAVLGVLTTLGGPAALKAVRMAVDDPDPAIRAAALRALASWKSVDVAPELLGLAKSAGNATDRLICLRGYLGWAANPEVAADQRLAMCQQAAGLVDSAEEKKLLLGTLGGIVETESLRMVTPYLADAATKEEASAAVVAIAEVALKGDRAAQWASPLIAPLQAAAEAAGNADLAKRAKAQLQEAQTKAAGK
jgi:hypothetical protein